MKKLLLVPLLLVPFYAGASEYPVGRAPSSNLYIAQSRVVVEEKLPGDLVAAGGAVTITAPVAGEILAAGGAVTASQGAGGNIRVAGGTVTISGPVEGDVAAAGGTIRIHSSARTIYAAGGSVDVEGSSTGDVVIYGANVFISGEYSGNVSIVASNRLALGENTHINGTLTYSAPEALVIPGSSTINGGTRYTGAYAYLPTNAQVHQFITLGTIIFFAVRVLAGCIVAGLVAGLFPRFARTVSGMLYTRDGYRLLRFFGIGLAVTIFTPVVTLLLLISFVGAGLAFVLMVLYALLALLAYAFTGITVGMILRNSFLNKTKGIHTLSWQDAVLGTILVHFIALLPYVGFTIIAVLTLLGVGALTKSAYDAAFPLSPREA